MKQCLVWAIGWWFVRSLSTRLALAMITVGIATLMLFVVLEALVFLREYRQLPAMLREPLRPHTSQREEDFLSQLSPRLRELYLERTQLYSDAIRDFRRARRRTIALSGMIASLLGIGLAIGLSRRISKPMAAVSRATSEMRTGQLSTRVKLDELQNADEETLALAQNFNAMAETLEKNELERKNMIADIAHELRTPLAVMQARLVAMQDEVIPLNASEIERVYKQTELLSRLVADLRTLSLAEAGRLSLNLHKIDLKKLLENVIANFEATARAKNVEIRLEAIQTVFVHADSDRLTQVFGNLLDNALRYTPAGKEISVKLLTQGNTVILELYDGGPGFSEEALAKAFDRFYKGDERSGSGLGLAIVKTLVELQGGLVAVKNHPDGGAMFSISLPKG